MDSGKSGSPFSVSSVCEARIFSGLGDGQDFKKKFQNFMHLMDFIYAWKHSFSSTLPLFEQNLNSGAKLATNPNFSVFEMIFGFCSYPRMD